MSATAHPRERFARLLPAQGVVLDVGCWSYSFSRYCEGLGLSGLRHFGVDRERPPGDPPAGFTFALADLESDPLPYADGHFDGVVLSHVIEHVARPLRLVDESLRVLKAGGWLYLECPSDRSLWLPSMPFKLEESRSLNFFDDPTHVGRPHTPQSLHRLFRMYGAEVVETRYLSSWSVRLRAPWLIPKALLRRDAAMLEDVVWRTFGFAVFGIARKAEAATRRYVLP